MCLAEYIVVLVMVTALLVLLMDIYATLLFLLKQHRE